ncbi:MAG TPA: phospholipase D family protein [Solirubrobacterales bacterium]|nr:phospholipase D family protein [Solirubrobacterales bacterium]
MAPDLRFRGQPFDAADTAGAFLAGALEDDAISRLTIVVAWARFGGLRRFQSDFTAFRKRGGKLRVILGIDEGIATIPGLSLAIEMADEAYVFHDRGSRTFHPKVYFAEGVDKALLLVGSSNLTAGGLYSNYEASLEAEFALPAEKDEPALVDASEFVAKLLSDDQLCLPLDATLLQRLIDSPRYAISAREDRRSSRRRPKELGEEEVDEFGETAERGDEIFGTSRYRKAPVRKLPKRAAVELKRIEPRFAPPVAGPSAAMSWTKVLPASDAQHPPSRASNPLGNMRLTQAEHPIDQLTWFRRELFGDADWRQEKDTRGNLIEVAQIPFAVTIDGRSHGTVELRLTHADHRESSQHNHATVLHWGPLGKVLRRTDYTGRLLTLQRMSDQSYRLDISR